jgi:hypothetical protein
MENNHYVLCHYHIFKNAGSSLDEALRKHFGKRWSPFEGRHANDILDFNDLRSFLNDHPDVKAVSSHLCKPPTPSSTVLPVVFLRSPLARARSVYEFTRKDLLQPFREAAASSFSDYLKWALSGEPGGHVIRDYQVVHLSSASFHKPSILHAKATESNYEEAIQLLEQWPVIGIVEKYAQSIKLIEKVYRPYIPKLRLIYEHENVSNLGKIGQIGKWFEKVNQRYCPKLNLAHQQENVMTANCKTAKLREEIGEELYQEFLNQNQLDYRLYEYGCLRLKQLCELNSIV